MQEERDNIIILIDDEGKEMPFEVLDIIEEDDKRYAVGIPAEEAEACLDQLKQVIPNAATIGYVTEKEDSYIILE